MPESPEVREYFHYIKPILLNKVINKIEIISGKYKRQNPGNWEILQKQLPNKVDDVLVKGKTIFINTGNIWMSFTHGMTGWWDTERIKHSRIVFQLEDNINLYYNDTRNFGKMVIYKDEAEFILDYDRLGPDVLDKDLTYEQFYSRINKKPRSKVGAILLDQKLVAGIGNYMRCDILWYAKINYTRTVGSLSETERLDLYNAVKVMCSHYLEFKFNDSESESDSESDSESESESVNYCFIYYKKRDPYGNEVKRRKWLGRTIHYVEFSV